MLTSGLRHISRNLLQTLLELFNRVCLPLLILLYFFFLGGGTACPFLGMSDLGIDGH